MLQKTLKEEIKQMEPILRSILAFILYLRFGSSRDIEDCYKSSDKFLKKLGDDL